MAYADPIPSNPESSWGRTDQGVDMTLGTDFHAIAVGRVLISHTSDSGWAGGGYMAVSIDNGPRAGDVYYVAEGIRPYRAQGFQVQPGWGICSRIPSPYNGIVGNCEMGWAMPSSPTVPLGHPEYSYDGKITQAGLDFRSFLTQLKSGTIPTATIVPTPTGGVDFTPIQDALAQSSMYEAMDPGTTKAQLRAHHGYVVSRDTRNRFNALTTFDKHGGH